MFRIELFIEDKHLPSVLHSLKGKALNLQVDSVENAKVVTKSKTKKVAEAGKSPQDLKAQLAEWITEKAGHRVTNAEMMEYYEGLGGNPASVNSAMLASFLDDGLITRIARGQYQANKA